jgi:hypothetical protein
VWRKRGSEAPIKLLCHTTFADAENPNSVANTELYMFRGEKKFRGGHCATRSLTGGNCTVRDEKELIVRFIGRGEGQVYARSPLDEEQLDG